MSKNSRAKWEWYAVKCLFEAAIEGQPSPETIDKNYTDRIKTFEERIILVKAQSFGQAYKIAEGKAQKEEHEYINPYDQLVKWRFVEALDVFYLFDDEIKSGSELYSRHFHVPIEVTSEEVIKNYYPEVFANGDEIPNNNFRLRVREFNARLNSGK